MKKRKFFLALTIILLLNVMPVFAAANKRIIQECTTCENLIQLYTYIEDSDKAEYSAKLSGIPLPSPIVESTEKDAVTWYILLDVSGSMKGTPFDCAKEVIRTIADNMTKQDNIVIATMGDRIMPSDFMSDPAEIDSYIEKLEVTNEDTNLYTGIVKSMEELVSNTYVNTKKCLIILSDGHNDQKKGSTEKEATSIVKEQTVPVFTVATLYENPSNEANEYADILGSFARDSLGGKHYVPVVENISATDIGMSIVQSMKNVQKLIFDLGTLSIEELENLAQKSDDTVTLRLSCLINGEKSYEDSLNIFRDILEIKIVETEAETEIKVQTEAMSETEMETETEKKEALGKEIPLFAGIAILLFIFLILLIKRNRKKDSAIEKKPDNDSGETVYEAEKSDEVEKADKDEKIIENRTAIPPAYKMHIVVIGDSSKKFQYLFDADKPFTMGRDDRADMKLIHDDMKLSGRNCQLTYNGKEMYITDISTNGTAVEGVKLIKNHPVKLTNNSKVRMGSYEYRLAWMRNE